jgi:PAS domain S-box-containing protein
MVQRITEQTRHSEFFECLYLLDDQSRVTALGLAAKFDHQWDASEWLGRDLSGLAIVQRARRHHTMTWSEQYLSPLLGVPVVTLALPVDQDLLLVEVSVSRLVDFMQRSSHLDGLLVLALDGKGELVAAPDMRLARTRSNLSNLGVVRAALDGSRAFQSFEFGEQAYFGTAVRSQRLGWVVVAAYPKSVADASRWVAISITSVTLLLAIGVGVLAYGWLAGLIQRRVQRTVAYARAVADGHYEPPEGQARIQELQQLDTSLQQMAQTIQRREQQLRAIVDNTPTLAIQWFDRHGRVLDWNPASETVLGWTREQAVGKTLDQLIYTPEQHQLFLQVLADIEKTGTPFGPYEGAVRVCSGAERYLLSTTFAIPDISGGQVFVCMDIDITEKRQMENDLRVLNAELEQRIAQRTASLMQVNQNLQVALSDLQQMQDHLVQSEKLASLGALVAGIAHELNTPIGNGLMAISTLEQRTKTFRTQMAAGLRRSDLDAFLGQVETGGSIATRNLARAAELITGFKRVAVDQTSVQRRKFELAELVHEILLTLQPMFKHSTVQLVVDVPSITMDGYPGPLGQVISNLVQNALMHAFDGRDQGTIHIDARLDGAQVTLTISDDGSGIAAELVRRVFDPFFTTRLGKGGSGLGLHIVHNIVTGMLGGQIELQRAPGSGAKFVVNIPVNAPLLAADAPQSTRA